MRILAELVGGVAMIVIFAFGIRFVTKAILQRQTEGKIDVEHAANVEPPAAAGKPD